MRRDDQRFCRDDHGGDAYCDEIGFARGDIIYGNRQGEEYEPCQFFLKNFKTVCPAAWVEKWDEQREKVRILFLANFHF